MKSCLKSNNSFSNKPKVRFESDHKKLEKVKIFKMTDTPNAPNITREEYLKIQKEISLDPHIFKIEDIRKKETKMDHIIEAQEHWRMPSSNLYLYFLGFILDNANQCEINSLECQVIEDICSKILSVHYFDNIPEPKEKSFKLFSFEDENIPKIENSKEATQSSNSTTKEEFLAYINTLQDKDMNPELIDKVSAKLEIVEGMSKEKKDEIINQLKTRMNNIQKDKLTQQPPMFFKQMLPPEMIQKLPIQMGIPFHPIPMFQSGIPHGIQNGMTPIIYPGMLPFMNKIVPDNNNIQRIEPSLLAPPKSSKIDLTKYKTKPCRNYHSPLGCKRGDFCIFIHDENFKGVEIPNFNPNNYEKQSFQGI